MVDAGGAAAIKKRRLQESSARIQTAAARHARAALDFLQDSLKTMDKETRLNTILALPLQARAALLSYMEAGKNSFAKPVKSKATRPGVKRTAWKRKCFRAADTVITELTRARCRHRLTALSLERLNQGAGRILLLEAYRRRWQCLGSALV